MSTNSLQPFGDVVAITPGGSLEDSFDWDEKQRKNNKTRFKTWFKPSIQLDKKKDYEIMYEH